VKISSTQFNELFVRYGANPIIHARDISNQSNSVFNARSNHFGDDSLLLIRVKDLRGISHLTAAHNWDCVADCQIESYSTLLASKDKYCGRKYGAKS
jgi:predicted GH43/DUF377 family glycosyl hydrolase